MVNMHFGMKRPQQWLDSLCERRNTIILSSLATFNTSQYVCWNHLDVLSSHAKERVCSAAPDDDHHDDVPQI